MFTSGMIIEWWRGGGERLAALAGGASCEMVDGFAGAWMHCGVEHYRASWVKGWCSSKAVVRMFLEMIETIVHGHMAHGDRFVSLSEPLDIYHTCVRRQLLVIRFAAARAEVSLNSASLAGKETSAGAVVAHNWLKI